MDQIYIGIGAFVFWLVALFIAAFGSYYLLRLIAGLYVGFAWFRMACKNKATLLNGYTPTWIALEAWLDCAFTDRVRKRDVNLHNGGGIYWESWWRFRVVAGDPDWRSGDKSLARNKRVSAG